MEERVEFRSEGETLVGTLFRPKGAVGPLPTVIAAGGWCYTKEIVLPHIAKILNESNVQMLGFDYANFGESSGHRRQHLDPWAQISGYRDALTYAEQREDVDADRLGAFGISYSGGHVLVLAATDPRVKAIVSVVPVVDGYMNMKRAHGEMRFRELEALILDDRRARLFGEGGTMPMSTLTPATELAGWPFTRTYEVFSKLKETEAPGHKHWNTIESMELFLNYDVSPFLSRLVDSRVMMLVAERDNMTLWDLEIGAFNQIPSPHKKLEILPAVSHMSLYSERSDTNLAGQIASSWFTRHLS